MGNPVPLRIVTAGDHASHLDHGLELNQRSYALAMIRKGRAILKVGKWGDGFYIASVKLPSDLGTVPCALRGPSVGDEPIADSDTFQGVRNGRPNASRLTRLPAGQSDTLTAIVIGGNLATMYGGPLAPREPNDPEIPENELEAATAFWAEHALSAGEFTID